MDPTAAGAQPLAHSARGPLTPGADARGLPATSAHYVRLSAGVLMGGCSARASLGGGPRAATGRGAASQRTRDFQQPHLHASCCCGGCQLDGHGGVAELHRIACRLHQHVRAREVCSSAPRRSKVSRNAAQDDSRRFGSSCGVQGTQPSTVACRFPHID